MPHFSLPPGPNVSPWPCKFKQPDKNIKLSLTTMTFVPTRKMMACKKSPYPRESQKVNNGILTGHWETCKFIRGMRNKTCQWRKRNPDATITMLRQMSSPLRANLSVEGIKIFLSLRRGRGAAQTQAWCLYMYVYNNCH